MEYSKVWEITRDTATQQIIGHWQPHTCTAGQVAQIVSSPVTAWLSVGFGALAAGASVYNAFQLAKQERMLSQIAQSLNLVNRKLDHVVHAVDQLCRLTNQVLNNTQDIKELAYVKVFFDGARINFKDKLRAGILPVDSLKSLIGDINATLAEVTRRKSLKDAPIPNWMIERASPAFSFLRIYNMFLIEAHNRFVNYEPTLVRRYEPIDQSPRYMREGSGNDTIAQGLAGLDDTFRIYSSAKSDKQPRLKWMSAFVWEAQLLLFNYHSSEPIQKEWTSPLMLPMIEESVMKSLTK